MKAKKPIFLYRGQRFDVECAVRTNGKCESKVFLDSLTVSDRAKIIKNIKRFANAGKIRNREKFKKVEGTDFWEFKEFQTRILMYYCARGHIALTHGFVKKGDRIPKQQIERAYTIKEEYELIRKRWEA